LPAQKRFKTIYPGVYYIEGKGVGSKKKEKIFYIMYRKNGKQIHEKAGRQFQDDMSAARAAKIRIRRIEGQESSNKAKRQAVEAKAATDANKWTINKLWDEYKACNPNIKGMITDENRFGNYIQSNFGDKEPRNLLPLDIKKMENEWLKTKSPGTVKNILELLRRIVNFGAKNRLCPSIDFTIQLPEVHNEKTEDLTSDQLAKLFKEIHKDSNIQAANMMKMALYTGMRRGEMFKLKWEDVKFETGFINIRDPKGGPDQRVPLNQAARQLLSEHPRAKSPYVFPGRNGHQRTDIKNQVNRIKEAAGLPKDFRALHGLRHVYASMLASSGKVELYTLQKLLTHKDPRMTQRYAHLHDEALKKASDVAADLFQEISKTESPVPK
jgi:integrase